MPLTQINKTDVFISKEEMSAFMASKVKGVDISKGTTTFRFQTGSDGWTVLVENTVVTGEDTAKKALTEPAPKP